MFCNNCGNYNEEAAAFCTKCGCDLNNINSNDAYARKNIMNTYENRPDDKLGIGFGILSFIIPLAGIIIFFSSKKQCPNKARKAIIIAGISIGLRVLVGILRSV